jgi:ankyrin repeat protein
MQKVSKIIEACYSGNILLLNEAIENGGDINKKYRADKPLRWAVQEGHLNIIKILVKNGANPFELDSQGMTLLDVACGEGYINIVKFLIKYGLDVNAISDGGFALQKACAYGHIEIVKELIKAGASIKAKDNEKHTARYYAKKHKHFEIVAFIDDQE